LDIDKCLRWVPGLNLALPGERDAKKMQSVGSSQGICFLRNGC
jgi:hypothetical protein